MQDDIYKTLRRDTRYVNRAFHYQYLKTLKLWLQYYLDSDLDTVIFCEKGDDIQIVNNKTNSKIIIQIKCYSNNISFNSQEVEKALIRFYSLFDRTYETIFLFDTNAKINQNDTLLLNWVNNQHDLRTDLLKEFINAVRPKIWADIAKKKVSVNKKNAIFNILNADLEIFVKNIRWYFDNNNETEVAVNKLVLENFELIKKIDNLKFPIEKFFSVLYQEVVNKSVAKIDENTKLDYDLLKDLISSCENDIDKFVDTEILTKINKILNENQITHKKLDEHKEILKKLDEKTDKILDEVTENKTYEKSEVFNSTLSNFSSFLNSGDIEFKSRNFENAINNYLTAIKHKDCQDKRKNYLLKQIELCKIEIQAEKLLMEGIGYLKLKIFEKAIICFKNAYDIFGTKRIENSKLIAYIYWQEIQGDMYFDDELFEKAIECYSRILKYTNIERIRKKIDIASDEIDFENSVLKGNYYYFQLQVNKNMTLIYYNFLRNNVIQHYENALFLKPEIDLIRKRLKELQQKKSFGYLLFMSIIYNIYFTIGAIIFVFVVASLFTFLYKTNKNEIMGVNENNICVAYIEKIHSNKLKIYDKSVILYYDSAIYYGNLAILENPENEVFKFNFQIAINIKNNCIYEISKFKIPINQKIIYLGEINEGLRYFKFTENEKYGYLDKNDIIIILPKFDKIETKKRDFFNGKAKVKIGKDEFYIKKNGERIDND